MTTTKLNAALAAILASLLLAACAQETSETPAAEADVDGADASASIYTAALNNSLRPDADKTRDAARKPAEVLEFIGIEEGMHVLDMFSGGGWYAEVIAHVVGKNGAVIAHTNSAYLNFVGDALEVRFGDGRVPQAEILMAENNQMSLESGSLDAVILALSYHDLYLDDPENGWELFDVPALLAELKNGLKPGGIVAVIDHYAASGAPSSVGNSLHRIDPDLVIHSMEAAGFEWDAQSSLLRNPNDDLRKSVFTPDLRGKIDRFVIRFRNPE